MTANDMDLLTEFTRDQSQFLAFVTAVHNNQTDLANYISGQLMDQTLQNGIKWWPSTVQYVLEAAS